MLQSVAEKARAAFSGQSAVRLDPSALPALCACAPETVEVPQTADDRGAALALLFGPVNHCFFTPEGAPYRPRDGASGGSGALRRAMAEAAIDWCDLNAVAALPLDDWRRLVGAPLYDIEGRHARLTGFARHLLRLGWSRVADTLAATPTVDALLRLLVASGGFEDPFLKRAQSTVFDVSQLVAVRTGRHLEGIDRLTLLADYRLVQLFLHAGVIAIADTDLDQRISERRPLSATAPETLALRAAVVLCSNLLHGGTAAEWDKRLWHLCKSLERDETLRVPPILVMTDQF